MKTDPKQSCHIERKNKHVAITLTGIKVRICVAEANLSEGKLNYYPAVRLESWVRQPDSDMWCLSRADRLAVIGTVIQPIK